MKEEQKHTPGPWLVGTLTGYVNQIQIEPAIGCAYGAGEEVAANARLIAAAPELLAVCKRAVAEWDGAGLIKLYPDIRAAIAKAEQ